VARGAQPVRERHPRRPKRPGAYLTLAVICVAAAIGCALAAGLIAKQRESEPATLTARISQLQQALAASHWVSPGLTPAASDNRVLYMVTFRSCPWCIVYEKEEFARLQKAGVDTRVILVARRDLDGKPKSSPAERATVAELWRTRDWGLYERWTGMPVAAWPGSGQVPPSADTDPDRRSAVEAGRAAVDRLTTLLKANDVELHYPALIWKAADGRWRSFIGYDEKAAAVIRGELGAG
jgi:hypothetical protein